MRRLFSFPPTTINEQQSATAQIGRHPNLIVGLIAGLIDNQIDSLTNLQPKAGGLIHWTRRVLVNINLTAYPFFCLQLM